MKCPNCKIDMQKGTLFGNGMVWSSKKQIGVAITKWSIGGSGKMVSAYRCPSCKIVQLQSEG